MTDFPNTPTVGDTVITDGITYQWNGSKWSIITGAIVNSVVQSDTGAIDLSKGDYHKILIDPDNLTVPVEFSNIPSGSSRWVVEFEINAATIGYDLANASYDNTSFNVSAQDTVPIGVFFKPDGTKMYVLGIVSDAVYEYNLGTAWDVSSAVYLQNFSVSAQDSLPRDIFFKPDGTKMYVVGDAGNNVNEYNLSAAWDISSATYLQNFSVAAQETTPYGIFFKPDGTKMYVVGDSGDDVNEYNLSAAWDVSSATYLQNFSVTAQDTGPVGLFFKPDGTKMYVLGNIGEDVNEYNLSTAWDISSATYLQNFSVAAQESNPFGLSFKPDGTKMYVVGNIGDTVYQYSTGIIYTISLSWPINIIWEANTPPIILENQNLILEFYTPDGGTTIYGIESINKDNT